MRAQEPVIFDRVLRPNPPLPPAALKVILVLVAAVNFLFASFFVLRGAWPVTPFMGLDVALLAWAFRASVRASRRREHVTLTASSLVVERRPAQGRAVEIAFNPYWVRVDMADPPEPGSRLTLWSHGRAVQIGSFLAPADKLSLARALKAALRRARETISA